MFIIRYATDSFFSNRFGDVYYCKNLETAREKLKELLQEDLDGNVIDRKILKEVSGQLKERMKKRKKFSNVGRFQFVSEFDDEFAFELYEQELI